MCQLVENLISNISNANDIKDNAFIEIDGNRYMHGYKIELQYLSRLDFVTQK